MKSAKEWKEYAIPVMCDKSPAASRFKISNIDTSNEYKCHYEVEIGPFDCFRNNLESALQGISKDYKRQPHDDNDNGDYLFSFSKSGVLTYTSETILPVKPKKNRVLMVFGNPAVNSVRNGMFFFSKGNGYRHPMWTKLKDARLMKDVAKHEPREEEANERRELILEDNASKEYSVGLTTFYSFPTPVTGKYANVAGVRKLFAPILSKINAMELGRILDYDFVKDATLVFVQKGTFEIFDTYYSFNPSGTKIKRCLYWPAVSRKEGKFKTGECLAQMLKRSS